MKRKTLAEGIRGSFSASAGWLFADLLLVLAMLFLAANTMGIHAPAATSTPTPTPTPAPKVVAQLEQTYHEFSFDVNTTALLAGNKQAANEVQQKIASQSFLQGRNAGLILVYGTDPACAPRASEISALVYKLVQQLGQSDPTFSKIAVYHNLCNPASDKDAITVDIFLFVQNG